MYRSRSSIVPHPKLLPPPAVEQPAVENEVFTVYHCLNLFYLFPFCDSLHVCVWLGVRVRVRVYVYVMSRHVVCVIGDACARCDLVPTKLHASFSRRSTPQRRRNPKDQSKLLPMTRAKRKSMSPLSLPLPAFLSLFLPLSHTRTHMHTCTHTHLVASYTRAVCT